MIARRTRLAVLGIALVSLCLGAEARSKKGTNKELEGDIRMFLEGRRLETRMPLPTTAVDSVQGKAIRRSVFTVVEADGNVRYLMPGGMSGLQPLVPQNVSLRECEGYIPAARSVLATGMEVDASRLELQVTDLSSSTRVGVRIRFPEGGAATATLEDVITGLVRIFDLGPEWGEAEGLERAWDALDDDVRSAESAWEGASGSSGDLRRDAGRRRIAALEAALSNREECGRLKGFPCYGTRKAREMLDAARADMADIDALEREMRVADARARVAESAAKLESRLALLEDGGRALAEREAAWTEGGELARERVVLIDEMASLGADVAAERSSFARDEGRLSVAGADIATRHRARRAEERLREWRTLGASASEQRAKLDTGSGSIAESEAALGTLRRLVTERRTLLDEMAGDDQEEPSGARAALDSERQAIEAAGSRLGTQRNAARLAELDAEMPRLEAEKASALARLGPSIGLPEQGKHARALLGVLQRLLENRRTAAGLGADSASSKAAAIEAEIAQYRSFDTGR